MKLNKFFKHVFFALIMLSGMLFSQTVHQVAAGTDVLKPAIDGAAAGDIIELISSGGLYLSADQIEIDKDITIRAAKDLAEKPILKYIGTATSAYMFKGVASARIELKGLEFDGDGTGEGAAALAKYVTRLDNGDPTASIGLHMDDCVAHDFNDKFIKPYGNCGMDSLVVTNSTFYNGASEGIVLYSGSSGDPAVDLEVAIIENCTFYNLEREAIKGQTNPNTKVLVNHCTFYDIGEVDKKAMIYFRDMTDVVVKNSIFSENNNADAEKFADFASDASLFHHNIIWNTTNFEVGNATVSDTLHADPIFTDAANADFVLDMSSPAIGFADDGNSAGDLRWDPTAQMPKVYEIAEGTDVIKSVLDAAAAGDTLELITSGGMYLNTDQMVIDKDIVIRARKGLAEKPVFKYVGTSTSAYMFKVVDSPAFTLEGIYFAGDGTSDGGAAKAKYLLRLDNGDPAGTMKITFENCDASGFADKIIKPYAECGIDSMFIRNSTFSDSREGVFLFSGTSSDPAVELDYAEIVNCTFYGLEREAIKGQTNPNTQALVDHCTFYNIGGTGKAFVYFADLTNVEIKNSIFMTNGYGSYFTRLASDANLFHNNIFYDVASHEILNGTSVVDTLFADPLFADAANNDFTLGAGSPARTYGEGGTPIGDLRWAIDPNAVILTVLTEGQGIVTLDPAGNIYSPGTSVQLTAVPDPNWGFVGWNGITVFPPDNPVATVVVNDNMTVTAKFVSNAPQVTLTLDSLGLGSVAVDPLPGATGTYDQGTEVTVTATPYTNWHFVEWFGDAASTNNPFTFAVDSNMTVTGSFASDFKQFSLNVDVTGKGEVSVNPLPILGTYDTNTVVVLSAAPVPGWQFDGFTGDLSSTSLVDSVTMDADKNIAAKFSEIQFGSSALEIDSTWDLYDAVMTANNNSIVDTLVLTTPGVYTSHNTADVAVLAPLTIMAKPGLEAKPVITNSDPEQSNLDIFRVYEDFTLIGVVVDGGNEQTHGMKYGIRLSNNSNGDTVRYGANQTFKDIDFLNLFEAKDIAKDGHAFKIDTQVRAGAVKFDGCTFNGTGYEAIRISDTEKWPTDRPLDTLIVRNCTFTNIDAEGIRYYSDPVDDTPDAPVIIEHCTFDNSATRVIYLKNSGGAIVKDLIISNSRLSNHGRDGDLLDAQGTMVYPSYVSHIDTFNVLAVPVKSTDGEVDTMTVYGINPEYEDAANFNWTLLATSHLYGLGSDGTAIGDLRWATNTTVNVTLTLSMNGNGNVDADPMPIGKTYSPGTVVALHPKADSGYVFVRWEGDLTGTDNPGSITMDANKTITAVFDVDTGIEEEIIPKVFSLDQNYPNPFNPTTMLRFGLPVDANVTLQVYDILGREVATIFNGSDLKAGYHTIEWAGTNNFGHKISSGIYIYRIYAKGADDKNFTNTKKMIMLK